MNISGGKGPYQGKNMTPTGGMNPELKGKRSGPGLKPGLNFADTGSVVNTVTGYVRFGRQKMSGNVSSRNSMVAGNASKK